MSQGNFTRPSWPKFQGSNPEWVNDNVKYPCTESPNAFDSRSSAIGGC